jgi:hypothetical protein
MAREEDGNLCRPTSVISIITDVLSLRTVCLYGRFFSTDVLSTDVLSLRTFCDGVLSGSFVTGCFVGESYHRHLMSFHKADMPFCVQDSFNSVIQPLV